MSKILAVDDERAILDALARVLGRDGHEVVREADPTAVPGMDLSRFDLVLCDVMMPGLDGFELVRQIRPDFDGPIVFLTARVAEEDAVAGYGLGADDYVRKPFGAAELRAVSVNIIFTISTNAFSPIAPTRIHRIRQRGCAAFGA